MQFLLESVWLGMVLKLFSITMIPSTLLKLFLLYINYKKLQLVMFADDTNLYCSGGDMNEFIEVVERELIMFKKWFDINKLSLNEDKTKCMVFRSARGNCEIK